MRRPRALQSGDRVAIVAPASSFSRDEFDAGIAEVRHLGFEPVFDDSIFERTATGYLAGSAERRAAAIRAAWRDPAIAGLIAVRGGYGSAQVLPLLDPAEARAAAKPFIGYSDLTAMLTFLTIHCDLVAFHGPMLDGRLGRGQDGYDRASFERVVCRAEAAGEMRAPGIETLHRGDVTGRLFGGTVTQLLASLGTPYAFNPPDGYVLFFDEVGERPYRLDRMVTQLRQTGLLGRAAAIVVGELPRCDEPGGSLLGRAVMADVLADFHGPVLMGFPSGHTAGPQMTLPFGVMCRVVADPHHPTLVIEEAAVQ
ncbi:MAG: LD-carboxypeptidase [Acidobacteriaceae bacterium]|jgi:muramoyltetrapeptide carboxypeptidase|nr:LD-carboxypeptidase [Acidobacteriaceae bacterium]